MKVNIGKERFGPWALITGASSGIGREFARQLAKAGLNTVLAARRRALLQEVGASLAKDFGVQYASGPKEYIDYAAMQRASQDEDPPNRRRSQFDPLPN